MLFYTNDERKKQILLLYFLHKKEIFQVILL